METLKMTPKEIKKTFWKKGTCSKTLFYLLNYGFEHPDDAKERAADPLAGGILQQGHQCGMAWGIALAAGAEVFRRYDDHNQAIAAAITASEKLLNTFVNRSQSPNCGEMTKTDWTKPLGIVKYMLTGKMFYCFNLAGTFAPEAFLVAKKELAQQEPHSEKVMSCATEVLRKMGASDDEAITAAGLAGGIGLSGEACGALGAAIWLKALRWSREHEGKSAFKLPEAKQTLATFKEASQGQMLCREITGRRFNTVDDHSTFIRNGGCQQLIDVLAQS